MATANARFHPLSASQLVMLANAALFSVEAILHFGVPLGPLTEPRIVAAGVTEMICALALILGAALPLYLRRGLSVSTVIGNLVALAGVALSVIALALGAGQHTISNEIAHALMTGLAFLSLWLLFIDRSRRRR